ncbi:MAG: hydroxyacylglutathione hydrolase [Cyanobacteriota bacterium]|nr:hydroxyacylglutathione hydrolase [Cyanobacteriota bacterium]
MEVDTVPALRDNYIFVLHAGKEAVVVDPALDGPIVSWLRSRGLNLLAILLTHHHADHVGGVPGLLQIWPNAQVYASASDQERIPWQTCGVSEGDCLSLLGREVRVLEVPGHTRTHVAYHLPATAPNMQEELFCGDTLFAGGCGRLFEGSAEQMHHSLQRLLALPEHTRVWCAHEYTEANLRWAVTQAPHLADIAQRLADVQEHRRRGRATIPTTLAEERRTNLFARACTSAELAALRAHKDGWNG